METNNKDFPKIGELMLKTAIFSKTILEFFKDDIELFEKAIQSYHEPTGQALLIAQKLGLNPDQVIKETEMFKEILEHFRDLIVFLKANSEKHEALVLRLNENDKQQTERLKKLFNF